METRNYKVNRDDIYVGELISITSKIYRHQADYTYFHTKPGELNVSSWFSYRSMLFVPNEEKLSNDLLYQSPNYPILNITDDEVCLSLKENSIVIKDAYSLAALLKYFGYAENLSFEDIMKIRKTFFNGKFYRENCELFGVREIKPEDWTYYKNGVEITDPKELKRRIAQERRMQQAGHRCFTNNPGGVLPNEYFNILDERGDAKSLKDAIVWDEKINAFAPDKREGLVRKLKRF